MHQRNYAIKVNGPVDAEGSLMLVCTQTSCIADIELPMYTDCFDGKPIHVDGHAFSHQAVDQAGRSFQVSGQILPQRLDITVTSGQGQYQLEGVRVDA